MSDKIKILSGVFYQAPPPEEEPLDEFEKARQDIQRRQKEPLDKKAFKRKLAAKQRGNLMSLKRLVKIFSGGKKSHWIKRLSKES